MYSLCGIFDIFATFDIFDSVPLLPLRLLREFNMFAIFDIFDFSFFISGAVVMAALLQWFGLLYELEKLEGAGVFGLVLGSYVAGMTSTDLHSSSRNSIPFGFRGTPRRLVALTARV